VLALEVHIDFDALYKSMYISLPHAGSRDNDVSCRADFHFLLHYVITIHQRYRQTDRQMEVMVVPVA